MIAKKRVVILGAGLAGLSAAWHLQKQGFDCRIFEREAQVGGLCRSKRFNGSNSSLRPGEEFTFDYSGHLLHFRHKYTLGLIKDLLGTNIIRHKRSAWIYSFGRFSRYPFQANLYGLPEAVVKECLLEFIKIHHNGSRIKQKGLSFQEWIEITFGKGIAGHFMIPYNAKFWTVPLDDLTCEWIDGIIPVPSLRQIIDGAIRESRRNLGYNAFFWYPEKGGIRELPQAFAAEIKNIFLNCPVNGIDLKRKEIRIGGRQKERYDLLISTLALPQMRHLLGTIPKDILVSFKNLRWNSIFNLNLGVEGEVNNFRHWAYFPGKEFCFFRVGFPHNFSSYLTPPGKSSIYVELSYPGNKAINKNNIVLRIKRDLKKTGMFNRDKRICVEDINDIKYAYPVYDRNYRQSREKILKFLIRNNCLACGRYGSWRYMSMEDVILDGKSASGLLLKNV